MANLAPVCVECLKEMICTKTGVVVKIPGHSRMRWSGDRYECDECSCEIIVNFGQKYETDHSDESSVLTLKVDQCQER